MKKAFLFAGLFAVMTAAAQDNPDKGRFVRRGLLRSESSFEVGKMFSQQVTNVYLQGGLEYYVSDNVSIRGMGAYYISTLGDHQPFAFHHDLLSGATWHFTTKSHLDPYVGFAPGISITALNMSNYIICDPGPCTPAEGKANVNPLATVHAGVSLYFQRWFHLFIETNYIYGRHYSDYYPQSLSELRFAFGLGWNLFLMKEKKV